MPKADDLLRQGRDEELWEMCCGFLKLDIRDFMDIQKRLLLEQLESLTSSPLGNKILRGARPKTVEEFRSQVPLTTYGDYCPELLEKREDALPMKPEMWAHSSGKSGEFPRKWIPVSADFAQELSIVLYGIGMLSCCEGWGDTSRIPDKAKLLYSVAPRPYISGTFADVLRTQTPLDYLPTLEEAENLSFEERIKLGFQQALFEGLDYFFGLSLVLVSVGEKLSEASSKIAIRPLLQHPGALWRLAKGKAKSKMARRGMLPKDLWNIKGIIGSGLDSGVYKERIRELWGRYPLDIYSCTEGAIIATQIWDYEDMTFIPNLNFLEFIPEDEHIKWQMDRSYQPKTVLLDEVEAGAAYEMVITNFHGGTLVRYRIGDMVRITSLQQEALGINVPQMAFECRTDNIIDLVAVKLTEKTIWQAIENSTVAYEDFTAFKNPGESVLNVLLETKNGFRFTEEEAAAKIQEKIRELGKSAYHQSGLIDDWRNALEFDVRVTFLPRGTFASYIARRQAEGADLAHIKPPHINPSDKDLDLLLTDMGETIVVTRAGAKTAPGVDTGIAI